MSNSNPKKTVYIIEDDSDILSLLSTVLKVHNFNCITDFNGNNFDVKRTPYPDVYIIDVNLIDKNGGELCIQIKNECPDIPVIIISAHIHADEAINDYKADKYVSKPFNLLEFIGIISSLLK